MADGEQLGGGRLLPAPSGRDAVPNGLTVEYMPRLFPLWQAVPAPVNGDLLMPTAPGLGLEFDQAAIDKYRA